MQNFLLRNHFCNYIKKANAPVYKSSSGQRMKTIVPPEGLTPEKVEKYYQEKLKEHYINIREISHPHFTKPRLAHRLLEKIPEGYRDRLTRKERRRIIDRMYIRDYCRKILYLYEKHNP